MFYLINFDVGQSRRANDSASIVKRAKERFGNSEMLNRSKRPNRNAAIIERV